MNYIGVMKEHPFLKIIAAIIIAILLTSILKHIVRFFFKKTDLTTEKKENTIESMLLSTIKYSTTIGFLIYSLTVLGVKIGNILYGAGILGIIVGFSARSFFKDFITGFFLLYEKQLKKGDYVEINSAHQGTVVDIGLRILRIRKWSGKRLTINNGQVQTIENFSVQKMRVMENVTIRFYENPKIAFSLLENTCNQLNKVLHPYLLKDQNNQPVEPFHLYGITSLNNQHMGYQYTVTALVMPHHYFTAQKEARELIAKALYKSGLTMSAQFVESRGNNPDIQ